jgi:hypothetical protein
MRYLSAFIVLCIFYALVEAQSIVEDSVYFYHVKPVLYKSVPELTKLEMKYREQTDGKYGLYIYISQCPDSTSQSHYRRDYYEVSVGHDGSITVHTVERFMVRKDFQEVLWYDLLEDTCYSLKDWRNKK